MDRCLKDLDDAREYSTDQLLIQLIHVQRLTDKIVHSHDGESPVDGQLDLPEPSIMAQIETFGAELDSLRNALPSNLNSNRTIPPTSVKTLPLLC